MLDRFLEGGGSGADIHTAQYHHVLFQSMEKLDGTLVKIDRMDLKVQDKYMVTSGLAFHEICSKLSKG
jgi:hypothetical protein